MLKISLAYPDTMTSAVTWRFATDSTIHIGRAPDNDVVLFSSLVSRHHLEISHDGQQWKILNLGKNGAFVIDGQLFDDNKFNDNLTIQLARRGSRLLINVNESSLDDSALAETMPERYGNLMIPSRRYQESSELKVYA